MNLCPHCQRTLLSHASARCNWCGAEITDSVYQEQAQGERDAYFAHQRDHDAASLWRTENINVNSIDPIIGFTPFARNMTRAAQQRLQGSGNLNAQRNSVIPPPVAAAPKADYFKMACEEPAAKHPANAQEPKTDNTPESRFNHLEID